MFLVSKLANNPIKRFKFTPSSVVSSISRGEFIPVIFIIGVRNETVHVVPVQTSIASTSSISVGNAVMEHQAHALALLAGLVSVLLI